MGKAGIRSELLGSSSGYAGIRPARCQVKRDNCQLELHRWQDPDVLGRYVPLHLKAYRGDK